MALLKVIRLKTHGLIDQAVRLGDSNAKFLGHFPASCYYREAENGRLIGAVTEGDTLLGYVLFRTTRDRAVIQHLCVSEEARKHGVAKAMIAELKSLVRHLPYIVCHCAREYPAYEAWRRLGFMPMGEKRGRGKDARILTRFVLDQGHAHLFSARDADLAGSRIVAVMDVNVALALHDASPDDQQILALTDDWLEEEVSFWIADEAFAEVDRNPVARERERRKSWLLTTPSIRHDPERVSGTYERY